MEQAKETLDVKSILGEYYQNFKETLTRYIIGFVAIGDAEEISHLSTHDLKDFYNMLYNVHIFHRNQLSLKKLVKTSKNKCNTEDLARVEACLLSELVDFSEIESEIAHIKELKDSGQEITLAEVVSGKILKIASAVE